MILFVHLAFVFLIIFKFYDASLIYWNKVQLIT